ncbi:MAG: hypothetical protein AAGA66_15830, partial [Bacteroidota bacterium]
MLKTSKAKNKTRRLSNSDLFKNKKVDESNDSIDVVDENDPSNNNLLLGNQPDKPKVNPSVVVNKQNNNNQNDSDDNSPLLNDVVDDTNNNDNNNPSENILDDNDDDLDEVKELPNDDVSQNSDNSSSVDLNKPYRIPDLFPIRTVKDMGNKTIVKSDALKTDGKMELLRRMELLRNNKADGDRLHYKVMKLVEAKAIDAFGEIGFNELYRGGHLIFKGQDLYNDLFELAKPLAPNENTPNDPNQVMTLTDAIGSYSGGYWYTPTKAQVGAKELLKGKMFRRRINKTETGHYEKVKKAPALPQLGIDFPYQDNLNVGGHLLFGITPSGDTFIQTEGAGFQ